MVLRRIENKILFLYKMRKVAERSEKTDVRLEQLGRFELRMKWQEHVTGGRNRWLHRWVRSL